MIMILFLLVIFQSVFVSAENSKTQDQQSFSSEDNNGIICFKDKPAITWCIPRDNHAEEEPWLYQHLTNASFPWIFEFEFTIMDVKEVNDKKQTISVSMYFELAWHEPRLEINDNSEDWNDVRMGATGEVDVSPEVLKYLWNPVIEIYGMTEFKSDRVLKEMMHVRINRTRFVFYESLVDITFSCGMKNFTKYPLDSHNCPFRVGSYSRTEETVISIGKLDLDNLKPRILQYSVEFEHLLDKDGIQAFDLKNFSVTGFVITLRRTKTQMFFQVYFTCMLFVLVSWVSFLINPDVVPGRMGLLLTTLLVLVNIFNGAKLNSPVSETLNAMDVYILCSIAQVFLTLIEYAIILALQGSKSESTQSVRASKRLLGSTIGIINQRTSSSLPKQRKRRNTLDSCSLFVFPIIFTIFNISYWRFYN